MQQDRHADEGQRAGDAASTIASTCFWPAVMNGS